MGVFCVWVLALSNQGSSEEASKEDGPSSLRGGATHTPLLTNPHTAPPLAHTHTPGMIYDQFFDFSRQLNVNVMAYEYSGYGKATGAPSEENCYADIDAAFKYLVEVRCVGCVGCFG